MRRLLALMFAFAVVVSACGGASTGDSSTTSNDAQEPTTTAAETTTTTAAPETTTTTVASAAGGEECLVGTWVLDTEAFVENFASIFANSVNPDTEATALDGTMTVEFSADGSLEAVREGWGFTFGVPEGKTTIEVNGTETGTWSVNGSTLIVNIDESDLEVTASVEAGGQVIEVPQGNAPIGAPQMMVSDSTFTCSGDVLTLNSAGIESVYNRA